MLSVEEAIGLIPDAIQKKQIDLSRNYLEFMRQEFIKDDKVDTFDFIYKNTLTGQDEEVSAPEIGLVPHPNYYMDDIEIAFDLKMVKGEGEQVECELTFPPFSLRSTTKDGRVNVKMKIKKMQLAETMHKLQDNLNNNMVKPEVVGKDE